MDIQTYHRITEENLKVLKYFHSYFLFICHAACLLQTICYDLTGTTVNILSDMFSCLTGTENIFIVTIIIIFFN